MKNVKIATFLKERKIKLKPDEANNSNLKRIEKIDFAGNITMAPTKTKTDMILVKKGDLVISGINVEKGALTIYQGEEDVLASIHYSAYEFDETQIYILYLKYFLKSREFRKLLIEQSGSGIKNEIKAKHILPLEIKLPSMQEQHRIVERIQAVENDIVELDKEVIQQYEYCKNLRQSILQQAVEGNLCEQNPDDEPASVLLEKIKKEKDELIKEGKIKKQKNLPPVYDEEKRFDIPYNWEWCKINDISFVTKLAGFEFTKYFSLTDYGEVPVIRAQNVRKNRIDTTNLLYIDMKTSKLLNRCALDKKCLLMTFIGAGIGDVAIFDEKQRFHLAPNVAKIELYGCVEEYILYFLLSTSGQKEIFKYHKATAQPSLSMETIREICIPIPPLQEQRRIVEKVNGLIILCDKLEKEVANIQQYATQLMESVLQEAFTNDEQAMEEQPKHNGKIIPIRAEQKAELRFAMAARGNIKQSTLESLQKRAIEISNGEK